ncbi:MAG: manganese catalase family protein [Stellaceae bacterium]
MPAETRARRQNDRDRYRSLLAHPPARPRRGVFARESGTVVRDLRADIAAEAGARQTYEALIRLAPDDGSRKTLTFLLTREVSHTEMFMKALAALGKLDQPNFGTVKPDETVDLYFNLSSEEVQKDCRGPWNREPGFKYIPDPTPQGGAPAQVVNPDDEHTAPKSR